MELVLSDLKKEKDVKEPMLYPKNLIYLSRAVFDSGLVDQPTDIAKFAKSMYELTLGFAFVFRTKNDYQLCHELLK